MNSEFTPFPYPKYPLAPWQLVLAGLASGLLYRLLLWSEMLPPADGSRMLLMFLLPPAVSAVLVWRTRNSEPGTKGQHMIEGALASALFMAGAFLPFPELLPGIIIVVPFAALYGAVCTTLFAVVARTSLSAARLPLSGWFPMLAGAVCGVVMRLTYHGEPGELYSPMNLSFIALAPLAVGAITVYVAERAERRSWSYYFLAGILANALFILGTMLIMVEGMICAIVIFPLFAVYGALGAVVMGALCRMTSWPRHSMYGIAVLPLLLGGLAPQGADDVFIGTEERSVLIQATPEAIWRQLHNTRNIQPAEVDGAWMFRIGVPMPQSGVTQATQNGHERTVTMGKSIHFTQVATDWEENRRVRWTYGFDADSFPPHALDDHVKIGGHYFDLVDTVYTLTPRGAGKTELSVRMQYRVSTQYNWYTKRVAQLLIGNLEGVFLHFYQGRAEAPA
jgi:hypothetical protein